MSELSQQFNIEVVINSQNNDPWNSSVNNSTWANSVQVILEKIWSIETGKALLNAIRKVGKWLVIIPMDQGAFGNSSNAATLDLRTGLSPNWQGRQHVYFSAVEYDPIRFTSPVYVRPGAKRFGGKPDEVLFHELIHAFRILTGARGNGQPVNFPMRLHYDNTEEFLAVVLTNIYISDFTNKGASSMRASHHGHNPLGADIASSVKFFKAGPQVLDLLKEFAARHPAFAADLCNVRAHFNPIKALFDPTLARLLAQMSASPYAANRALGEGILTQASDVWKRTFPDRAPIPTPAQYKAAGAEIAHDLATTALRILNL